MPNANRIPVEASEDLAFTPSRLLELHESGKIEEPPRFVLRACTERDKRFREGLMIEVGAWKHGKDEVRVETLRGLEAMWDKATFDRHKPILEQYWQAREDYELQRKDDPDLVWEYDAAIEQAVNDLNRDLVREWRPLGKMLARNAHADRMALNTVVAVAVRSFTGLGFEPEIDRRYLDIDSVDAIEDRLDKLDEQHGIDAGSSWTELWAECLGRLFLPEEDAGNSASPSPSGKPQRSSKAGAEAAAGTSPESGTSKETPETASSPGTGTSSGSTADATAE